MGGRLRRGGTRAALLRIAAVLFALADLGERRAHAPLPARMLLIWALRLADVLFKEFVFDVSADLPDDVWLPDLVEAGSGHDPAVAIDLALSLRLLALAMQVIATHVDADGPTNPVFAPDSTHRFGRMMGRAPAAHDFQRPSAPTPPDTY